MKSIRIKLVIMYLTLVFIVMIVCGTYMLMQIRFQEFDRLQNELSDFAAFFESYIRANIPLDSITEEGYQADLQAVLKTMYQTRDSTKEMEGSILDKNGITIYTTAVNITNYRSTAIVQAMAGQATFNSNRWGTDTNDLQSEMIEYAYPLTDTETGEMKCIIFVRMKAESIYTRLNGIINVYVITLAIALVLAGVLGGLFSGTITSPIIALTRKAVDLAHGNLSQQIAVKSNDEIGQLTVSFNNMATELNQTLETMTTEKNKMEILLHTMTDGVLAYDNQGKLIHANYSSQELLGVNNLEDLSFNEVSGRLGLAADIGSFEPKAPGALREAAAYIGDKYISSIFSPYFNKHNLLDGVVIVLQDITKHKKLDDMRKEFVANVSHEIRTPLTTIKSYTETLMDGGIDDANMSGEFLSIINKETDRMAVLVNDLLELSRFDNKQFALNLSDVELNDLTALSVRQMKLLAGKKSQSLTFTPAPGDIRIEADANRLLRVFINIIGNAINYSPDGAAITVTTEKSDRFCRVYIRDTGMGIPKEDQRRIFERFYRVDKARSRSMGGTGLGLAIAKEIVEAHGGKITVNSEPGKGTCMILRFNRMHEAGDLNAASVIQTDVN